MHETAVVMGLIGILERQAKAAGIGRITEVRVKLGRLRGLDARQLVGVFEILAEGGRLDGARLVVEDVAVAAHCRACGADYDVAGWALACPRCGSDDVDVVHGRELHIESFDGIRAEAEPPAD
jgi:hydrogenase nickel incorporation protein HypA/HybF